MILGLRFACKTCGQLLGEGVSPSQEIIESIKNHLTTHIDHEVVTRFILISEEID